MNIGLNVGSNVYISIGQTFNCIKESLEKAKIEYNIPFDNTKSNSDNKVIVLYIDKCGVELNIINNKVTYIKSNNYDSNILFEIEDIPDNKAILLKSILKKICDKYSIEYKNIQVESYDTSNLNIVLRLYNSIKISIICNGRNIHIHTVKQMEPSSN